MANAFDYPNFSPANWDGIDHYAFYGYDGAGTGYYGLYKNCINPSAAGDIASCTLVNNGIEDVTVTVTVNFAYVDSVLVPAFGTATLSAGVLADGDLAGITTDNLYDYTMDLYLYPSAGPPVGTLWTDFIGTYEQ